ncbi:7393466b-ccd2-4a43-a0a5-5beb1b3a10ff [Thermothielavioides terrestris]|uniref:7393466b-ccd2-4a43-a0a5-5beb1b3a10ff n=1 Tax=Thermothielavioides terrestris TaxID=2587410 RepID=A0A3S4C647_9PEZI|nr:7393466b-ccd2-4a43-a0a5-5beb1b3a10ff [Thermothielavioides terrestris]
MAEQVDQAGGGDALDAAGLRDVLGAGLLEDGALDDAQAADGVVVEVGRQGELLVAAQAGGLGSLQADVGLVDDVDGDALADAGGERVRVDARDRRGQVLRPDARQAQHVAAAAAAERVGGGGGRGDGHAGALPLGRGQQRVAQQAAQVGGAAGVVAEARPARVRHDPPGAGARGQPHVGVVRPGAEAELGAGREHAVGLRDALGDEVVDHDADVGVRAGEPGRAVDLAGEVEPTDGLGLEAALEAARVDVVVLDAVAGLEHHDVLEPADRAEELLLGLGRDRHAEPVGVDDVVVEAFGLEPDDVALAVAEADHLGLERGAVPGPLDRLADVDRLVEVGPHDVVGRLVGVGGVAQQLVLHCHGVVEVAEGHRGVVAALHLENVPLDAVLGQPRRRARLEPAELEAGVAERLAQPEGRLLTHPAGGVGLEADVDLAAEEGAGGDDDLAGGQHLARLEAHARDLALGAVGGRVVVVVGDDNVGHPPQEDGQVRIRLELLAHVLLVERAVDLGARAPDGRAFPLVEHPELHAGLVNDAPREAVHGVDLAQDGALADAAKAGIARADAEVVDVGGDERSASAGTGCGRARLGASMAAANDDDIERPAVYESRTMRALEGSGSLCNATEAHLESALTVAKPRRSRSLTLYRQTGLRSGLLRPLGSQSFVMAVGLRRAAAWNS